MKAFKINRCLTVILASTALGFGTVALNGCSSDTAGKSEKAAHYTCPMHPEVMKDQPGDCPKCGMKLVEKK
jgi:hypothetical protein